MVGQVVTGQQVVVMREPPTCAILELQQREWILYIRQHQNGVEAFCIRVCLSVSESVPPDNLVNTVSQKSMGISVISPNFCHNVFVFIDVLIRFWGQKVKGEGGHSRRRHHRRRQTVEFHLDF